jgi:hypothetical protein
VKESRTATAHIKHPHLHALTSTKDAEIAEQKTTISSLQKDLTGTRSLATYLEARTLSLCGKLSSSKEAHKQEIVALRTSAVARSQDLLRVSGLLGKYVAAFEVLFLLGERTGEELTVAVAFVWAMKICGVDVVALGVDKQRVTLLWDFVLAGQGGAFGVSASGRC